MSFYENYLRMCNRRNVSPSRAAIEAGTTKTSVNRWKSGSVPSDATLLKLADYFKCSVDELRGIEETKPPAAETGDGRYGLSAAQWRQIGSMFRTKLLSMPKAPAWLATAQTGLSEKEVEAFFAGERFVTKAQMHAMAEQMGVALWDIIGAYAQAFDGEEDEVIAARDWLRRAADQLSPELLKEAVRFLDIPKEDEQSAADDLALLRHVRRKPQ